MDIQKQHVIAELSQKLADYQDDNARQAKLLEPTNDWRKWKQKQLNETQKYLLEANQEVEQIESKYRAVLIFNYVLSLVILGDCYPMGVSMILKENDLPDDIIQSLGEVS